jgi:putative glutamine amidotransferase
VSYVLIPVKRFENSYVGTRTYYYGYFSQFGDVIQIPVATTDVYKDLLSKARMVVLPGGADINPMRYGEMPSIDTDNADPFLEYYDQTLLPLAIQMDVPVVGICRGFQSLLVHYGGKLCQELLNHPRSETWDQLVHDVNRYDTLDKIETVKLNSLHHQGQYTHAMPRSLKVLAWTQDRVCEAFTHESDRILGIQWHPEVLGADYWVDEWIDRMLD